MKESVLPGEFLPSVASESDMPKLKILADMSEGAAPPIEIYAPLKNVLELQRLLPDKNLMLLVVGTSAVVVGAVIGVKFKQNLENRKEEQQIILDDVKGAEFDDLIDENLTRVFNFLRYGLGGDEKRSEELTQEVYLRAYRRFDQFKPEGKLSSTAWIFRIAKNVLKNEYRDESRRPVTQTTNTKSDEDEDYIDTFADAQLNKVHSLEIQTEVDPNILLLRLLITELSWKNQFVIYLKSLDFGDKEIAKILFTTEGGVKSQYHRTMVKLHEKMNDRVGNS